jgi:hypothetical protein
MAVLSSKILDKAGVSAREMRRGLMPERKIVICLVIVRMVGKNIWGGTHRRLAEETGTRKADM